MTAPIQPTSSSAGATQSAAASTSMNTSMGQDDFLKLLVAQMKNQDPTNPMDGKDLAAQLAQFSSLNQLVDINSALSAQNTASQGIEQAVTMNTAATTIGRTVTATGNQVAVTNGTAPTITFDVGSTGGDATVHIFDAAGAEVDTEHLGSLNGGHQKITLGATAAGLTSGAYTYQVEVTDSTGASVPVTTYTVAKIDSLQATANGPVLGAGPLTIPFGSVTAISGS